MKLDIASTLTGALAATGLLLVLGASPSIQDHAEPEENRLLDYQALFPPNTVSREEMGKVADFLAEQSKQRWRPVSNIYVVGRNDTFQLSSHPTRLDPIIFSRLHKEK